MLTTEPTLAQDLGDQPEERYSGRGSVDVTKVVVLLVEEDLQLRRQLLQAIPGKAGAQAFPGLDELDGAKFRPGSPVVLVLGPSQATAEALERVGELLRATRGAGAILVVEHPSAKVMSLALRSGVNDALELAEVGPQLARTIGDVAFRLDEELAAPPIRHEPGSGGRRRAFVTSVFSPKGGVGKSVVAVNLAAALARSSGEPVVVLDLDLQFGDVAVMLRLQPLHTFTDAISAGDRLDETLLRSFLARHEKSGVYVLSAPTSPSEADQVDAAAMLRVLDLLRDMFGHVVIDTPPHLSEVVLQAVAESDLVSFIVAMDVPSVKNARLGLQAFSLLQLPLAKVVLLLNRAGSKVHLAPHDIERVLEMKVDLSLPSDVAVTQSVNQGVPVLLEYPRSPFSGQVLLLANLVLSRRRGRARDLDGQTMSSGANGSGFPGWGAANNESGLPRNAAQSNGNGSSKGTDDRAAQPGSVKPPGGASLYGRLQEGMGFADPRADALDAVRVRVHRRVISELGPVFYNNLVDQKELRSRVERIVQAALRAEKTAMSAAESAQVAQSVADDVLGYGPIERLLNDPTISEIMVNGPDKVYIERNGKITPTKVSFLDEAHLRHVTGRIVAEVGRHIDESSPMVDARLQDGSRVNAIYPPLAVGGPFLTIRKFAKDPYTLQDLIGFSTFTPQVGELLEACVEGRANILVSGGASTGKTTLLNVMSSFIPTDERIITIEDAKELQLRQRHVVSLESRPPNTEGKGEVSIRDLLRNSLRMRPDRIIIGECRSGEALDMLQAMNTGHEGSLTTVHANSPTDALSRVETMTLMAGFDLPVRAVREQLSSALDLIVHLARLKDGTRRVTQVTEVGHMESDVILLQDIFVFDFRMGSDAVGRSLGRLKATGLRPQFTERLADRGVKVDPSIFDPAGDTRMASISRHSMPSPSVWPR